MGKQRKIFMCYTRKKECELQKTKYGRERRMGRESNDKFGNRVDPIHVS